MSDSNTENVNIADDSNAGDTRQQKEFHEESPEEPVEGSEAYYLKKLEEKESQCAELTDRLQRNLAEFDNFRKRTLKEKTSMYDDGAADTITKLLPVIDNFERAVASYIKTDENDSFYTGVEMILRQFEETLASMEVTEILSLRLKFDPNVHFAVAHVEDKEFGENEVAEILQKGYKYKDRVIRHSMVKVAN